MSIAVTITQVDPSEYNVDVYGVMVLSGNYGPGVNGHGDIVNWSNLPQIPSNAIPAFVDIAEAPSAGTAPNGYIFNFCPGTTPANGVVTITNNLAELTPNSTYSAGLLAAVIIFKASFPIFVPNALSPV